MVNIRFFQKMSIGRKLLFCIMAVCVMTLFLSNTARLISDYVSARQYANTELQRIAQMLGQNVSSALDFMDTRTANDVLKAMRIEQDIVRVCLYDFDGHLFADYRKMEKSRKSTLKPAGAAKESCGPEQTLTETEEWNLLRTIFSIKAADNRKIGTLYAEYSLENMHHSFLKRLVSDIIILWIVFGIAWLCANYIRRIILEPLLHLVNIAKTFTSTKDYSLRAVKTTEDELGEFVDAFNQMMEEAAHHESALKKAKDQAEYATRMKSDFLANMSHELRTPMHAILNYSKTGIKRLENADKQQLEKYFNNIFSSGDRLSRLLNNLLDMSKIEAGKMEYHFREQSLKRAIEQMQIELQSLLDAKHIILTIEEKTENLIVTFDYERIVQVIINLMSNAVKFTPNQSTITVTISEDHMKIDNRDYPVLRIRIADQGVGIPEDELDSIFDKFIQSSKTKTGAGGTGLGLSISSDIVKAHHGKIWAENNPDGGASFIFYLHRTIPAATETA